MKRVRAVWIDTRFMEARKRRVVLMANYEQHISSSKLTIMQEFEDKKKEERGSDINRKTE